MSDLLNKKASTLSITFFVNLNEKPTKTIDSKPSQGEISSRLTVPNNNYDDDTEIVVVSDTVRQRRSRTPSQNENVTTDSKAKSIIMPDLLPRTFHLAETSALFSQINEPKSLLTSKDEADGEAKFSVVEIRETNLTTPKKVVSTFNIQNQNIGQSLNTCSILESVSYLAPSCVETVHIIDVTSDPSDTDTCCSTPNLDERPEIRVSSDDDDDGESEEYETGEPGPELSPTIKVFTTQISLEEDKKPMQKERDLLKDSEQSKVPPKPKRKKLTPTLQEILTSDRDSFYGADKELYDEPLIFSDDDENQRSRGQSTDFFNRDTVLIKKTLTQTNQTKQKFPNSNYEVFFFLRKSAWYSIQKQGCSLDRFRIFDAKNSISHENGQFCYFN